MISPFISLLTNWHTLDLCAHLLLYFGAHFGGRVGVRGKYDTKQVRRVADKFEDCDVEEYQQWLLTYLIKVQQVTLETKLRFHAR